MYIGDVADKALQLVNKQLDTISENLSAITNLQDQIRIAKEIAEIIQILNKSQALQEAQDGQTQKENSQASTQISKKETLEDVFTDNSDTNNNN